MCSVTTTQTCPLRERLIALTYDLVFDHKEDMNAFRNILHHFLLNFNNDHLRQHYNLKRTKVVDLKVPDSFYEDPDKFITDAMAYFDKRTQRSRRFVNHDKPRCRRIQNDFQVTIRNCARSLLNYGDEVEGLNNVRQSLLGAARRALARSYLLEVIKTEARGGYSGSHEYIRVSKEIFDKLTLFAMIYGFRKRTIAFNYILAFYINKQK